MACVGLRQKPPKLNMKSIMGRGKVPKSLPPLPSGASASRWNLEQTLRRAQAMGDLRNAVSAAAVGRGVLFDNPENMLGAIRGSHLANMDATTLVLHTEGARAQRTYFFKSESKKARKKNQQLQAVGETKTPTKYLRIKFWCTTLASGKLCTPVFSLVVDGLQTMERIKVFLLLYLVERCRCRGGRGLDETDLPAPQ